VGKLADGWIRTYAGTDGTFLVCEQLLSFAYYIHHPYPYPYPYPTNETDFSVVSIFLCLDIMSCHIISHHGDVFDTGIYTSYIYRRYAVQKGHDIPYAKQRYLDEGKRLFGVLDKQLSGQDYVVGEHSIADIMIYGWALAPSKFYSTPESDVASEFKQFKNVAAWLERMQKRPAVQRGEKVNSSS
jgi:glutathione S-transferase